MSSSRPTAPGGDAIPQGPLDASAARALLDRARDLYATGEFEAAAQAYARLVGHGEPIVHVAALLGLADARYRLDDEEAALQAWITATQAPETPITWQAWVALAGARVRQGDLAGAARAYREAERRAPAYEQPQIASRLGWLSKEMGQAGTAERHFGRARSRQTFSPVATWAILAATVAVGLASLLSEQTGELLFSLLALDKEAVRQGELWRLLTVVLVHGNVLHLAFNMYALYIVGPLVEALYGRVLFVAFYLVSAAAGSVASYLIVENPSVGASGAVFGLFGLLMLATFVHRTAAGHQARSLSGQIAILIVFNLAIGFGIGGGFMGGRIDNAAHVGGLLAGAWLGFSIAPRMRALRGPGQPGPTGNPLLRLAAILVVVAVIAAAVSLTPLWA